MKLLKSAARYQAADQGNVNMMTVMGEALMDGLSDAGSTPARSTEKTPCLRRFFYYGAITNPSRLSQFRMIRVLLLISLIDN